MHNHVIDAYREAYGQFKDSVNNLIGKDGAELNRRVSNLMSARNALKELTVQDKRGATAPVEVNKPTAAIKGGIGHLAPALIRGAQKVAGAIDKTVDAGGRVAE